MKCGVVRKFNSTRNCCGWEAGVGLGQWLLPQEIHTESWPLGGEPVVKLFDYDKQHQSIENLTFLYR